MVILSRKKSIQDLEIEEVIKHKVTVCQSAGKRLSHSWMTELSAFQVIRHQNRNLSPQEKKKKKRVITDFLPPGGTRKLFFILRTRTRMLLKAEAAEGEKCCIGPRHYDR